MTVTLPERTLHRLANLDEDRAMAIVKAAELASKPVDGEPKVRVVKVCRDRSLITIGYSRALAQIPWLRLAEIGPGQYLLVVPTGTSVERLELAILDQLEELPPTEERERALLSGLREEICQQRRQAAVSKEEVLLISA